ncbi:MAG TPA: DUF2795 domain-containing protein [Amycolatopsis sp.]|uniref:DUF2795 domain-containing protein n=1 Tax=Amycolatopsis sp. TaxID=37632 RepID=UPI002B4A3AEA|nr:DUF2795 domain-containing protein [Amycolatopsis sp.]HKS48619.1 DUF2795 domain-containing protein [Amycolatopsis sp.]
MEDRLRTLLSDLDFPCGRADLLRHAAACGADDDILGHLGALPEGSYAGIDAVARKIPHAPGQK